MAAENLDFRSRKDSWKIGDRAKNRMKNPPSGTVFDSLLLAMYKLLRTCPYWFKVSLFRLPEIGSYEIANRCLMLALTLGAVLCTSASAVSAAGTPPDTPTILGSEAMSGAELDRIPRTTMSNRHYPQARGKATELSLLASEHSILCGAIGFVEDATSWWPLAQRCLFVARRCERTQRLARAI
jgi:hypothetical protein